MCSVCGVCACSTLLQGRTCSFRVGILQATGATSAYRVPTASLCAPIGRTVMTSDPAHLQSIVLPKASAHWVFSLQGTIHHKTFEISCCDVKKARDQQFVKHSDPTEILLSLVLMLRTLKSTRVLFQPHISNALLGFCRMIGRRAICVDKRLCSATPGTPTRTVFDV